MLTLDELESIIFIAGEDGISVATIATALNQPEEGIANMIVELQSLCESSSRPYSVISIKGSVSFVTKPKYSSVISSVRVQVEKQPLTKSHIEVLSILMYNGPTTKIDIDAYRGVNSGQALRSLSLRGMVEKAGTSHGSAIYQASSDVLHMLGITAREELPQFQHLQDQLRAVDSKTE
jgi:segregation and condensation protein B